MKEQFEQLSFQPATMALIDTMSGILEEYASQGYVLTVRQLYYQMVARDHIPNNLRSYKRLVNHCANGRRAGLLDWAHLEDTARRTLYPPSWNSPADIVESAAAQFRIDRWQDQEWRVLVMIEKEALAGVFRNPCRQHHVRLYPNRGYTSLSYMYDVGRLLHSMAWQGLKVALVYFGDHDPSGMDMDRDIQDRLGMFSRWTEFDFRRIALTMEQINQYNPPPDPAKLTDSRASGYIAEYGTSSWELDALTPQVLVNLLDDVIMDYKDQDIWEETIDRENEMRSELEGFAASYRASQEEQNG